MEAIENTTSIILDAETIRSQCIGIHYYRDASLRTTALQKAPQAILFYVQHQSLSTHQLKLRKPIRMWTQAFHTASV